MNKLPRVVLNLAKLTQRRCREAGIAMTLVERVGGRPAGSGAFDGCRFKPVGRFTFGESGELSRLSRINQNAVTTANTGIGRRDGAIGRDKFKCGTGNLKSVERLRRNAPP